MRHGWFVLTRGDRRVMRDGDNIMACRALQVRMRSGYAEADMASGVGGQGNTTQPGDEHRPDQ